MLKALLSDILFSMGKNKPQTELFVRDEDRLRAQAIVNEELGASYIRICNETNVASGVLVDLTGGIPYPASTEGLQAGQASTYDFIEGCSAADQG